MKTTLLFALALLVALVNCQRPNETTPKNTGNPPPGTRPQDKNAGVVKKGSDGGRISKQTFFSGSFSSNFPWTVSISVVKSLFPPASPPTVPIPSFPRYCGGSLIDWNWILSSGSCTGIGNLSVLFGSQDRSNPLALNTLSMGIPESNVFVHPNFNPQTLENDISLIKLPYSAPLPTLLNPNNLINSVLLPTRSDLLNQFLGQTGFLSGFGLNNFNLSNILGWTPQQFIPNVDCAKYFASGATNSFPIRLSNLCLVNNLTNSIAGLCNVESGSPLVVQNPITKIFSLQGIASFPPWNCLKNSPFAFTRVANYTNWISRLTGLLIP
ncbi:trypsin-4-like [Neocloeon triangulifer]|uniref:trypsin-4-like n=1 Tax=Neocloeon triangulifer TaxID=2078957 RepID=UPI00286F4CFB|nr:trypsin-4-like [Neocloeon triangulifer]